MEMAGMNECSITSHSYADDVESCMHCLTLEGASTAQTVSHGRPYCLDKIQYNIRLIQNSG